jgi:cobalt/nickel transport system permease protein
LVETSSILNRYREGESFLHTADTRVKLVITLGFIFAITSLPPGAWPAFGAFLVLVWGSVAWSRVGLGLVFRRSLLALPFVLIALPTIFTKPGEGLFELNVLVGRLTATSEGLEFFGSVLLKSWASVTAAALLTATTPPFRLLEALRALKVPAVLVAIVMLMYRYLFVLVDEAQRLLRARRARSAGIGPHSGGGILWRGKVTGRMAGSLFIRTLDRGERIYLAMLARGYDGTSRQAGSAPLGWTRKLTTAGILAVFASISGPAQMVW